MQSITFCCCF